MNLENVFFVQLRLAFCLRKHRLNASTDKCEARMKMNPVSLILNQGPPSGESKETLSKSCMDLLPLFFESLFLGNLLLHVQVAIGKSINQTGGVERGTLWILITIIFGEAVIHFWVTILFVSVYDSMSHTRCLKHSRLLPAILNLSHYIMLIFPSKSLMDGSIKTYCIFSCTVIR